MNPQLKTRYIGASANLQQKAAVLFVVLMIGLGLAHCGNSGPLRLYRVRSLYVILAHVPRSGRDAAPFSAMNHMRDSGMAISFTFYNYFQVRTVSLILVSFVTWCCL